MPVKRFAFLSVFVLNLALLTTSVIADELSNPQQWKSTLLTDHPLVGKIWSREKAAFVTPGELEQALKEKSFILLGETHDNPDHHWLQAKVISHLSSGKSKPNLVIEMIRVDQMPRLEGYLKQDNAKAKFLGRALQWELNGWPDWEIYQPIGKQIFAHKLEVYPGLPSRMTNRHLIKSNLSILPQKARETFKLNTPLEAPLQEALFEDVRVAHCNRLPERVVEPMANVQRFRDAWMADVMIQAETDDAGNKHQVVLIAGSGHMRDDRGVPWYLKKRTAEKAETKQNTGTNNVITIHFIETDKDAKTIEDLSPKSPDGKLIADYIWVTPAIDHGNPCDRIPDFGKK